MSIVSVCKLWEDKKTNDIEINNNDDYKYEDSIGIDRERIFSTVKRAYEKAGFGKYIKPGQIVLVKPNLVAVPPQRVSGAVTMAEVSEAVACLVQKAGAKAIIADSSAVGVDTEDVIGVCAYDELRQMGYEVRDLKKDEIVQFKGFKVYKTLEEADVIISLPVMKTHDQFEISLGVKNLKGLLIDTEKKDFHNKYKLAEALSDFVKSLMAEKKVLSLMDALVALEGRGPVIGNPVKMGYVLASDDIVALDSIAAKMMGVKLEELIIESKLSKKLNISKQVKLIMQRDKIKITGDFDSIGQIPVKYFDRDKNVSINADNFEVIFYDKTCTGCKNTVISCLQTIKENNEESVLANKKIFAGEGFGHACSDGTEWIFVGSCLNQNKYKSQRVKTINGCPPQNMEVLKTLREVEHTKE